MSSPIQTTSEARQRLNEIRHSGVSFEEKAREALEVGEQYLGADSGYLTRIEPETDHWEATVSTASQDGQFPPERELNLGTTYSRRTIAENEPITLHNAPAQGWEDDPAFETYGINFYHGTPLYLDGEPHGSLCFVAGDPRDEPFRNEETLLAGLIARMLEQELERQNHQTELTRRRNLVNVLNRVLRHNIRNDMTVIRAHTQRIADQLGNPSSATTVLDKIDGLIELSEKARKVEEIVEQDHARRQTNLETLSQGVVTDVRTEYPAATITLDVDADITAQLLPSLERAVRELVENAAKHGGASPSVTVAVEESPQSVEIRITDTGPGLSDQEREVLKTGVETPLIHGSGLGLWLVHWIVASHDGTVEANTTGTGTIMTVSLPRDPASDDTQDLADLRQATDQYQAAFEESFDAQLLLNDQARIIEANPAAERIFGLEQAEFRGLSLAEFYPEGFDFDACWSAFLDDGRNRDINTLSGPGGKSRRVEYSAVTDVVPGQHLFVAQDVTERQQRKADLETYETVLNSINDPAWVYDDNKQISFANQPDLDGLSLSHKQLIGMPLSAFEGLFADTETYEAWEALIDEVLAGDVTEGDLDVTFDVQGDPLVMNLRVAPIPDNNNPTGVAVIASDVTERKQRERVLAEYETIIEALNDAVYVLDEDGKFTYANDELVELVGYDRETIVGNTPSLFKDAETVEQAEHQLGRLLSSEGPDTVTFEVMIQPRDSDPIICEDKMGVLPYEGDEFSGSVGTLRDITEHKEERERIEFLESLSTRLTALSSDLLRPSEERVDPKINEALETMGSLVEADRSYVFDVNQDDQTLSNTHEWTSEGVASQIDNLQHMSFDTLPWWVEKLETGEALTIEDVSNLPSEAFSEQKLLQAQDIESLIVSPVMSKDKLVGFIGFDWVEKQPPWSEDFVHILQICGEIISSAIEREERERVLEGYETIHRKIPDTSEPPEIRVLYVDDRPATAKSVAGMLEHEDNKFTVEVATSASQGLESINDCPPDCVLSEYSMSGMDGIEFLEAVREEYPDLPFILYTDKGSEAVASEAIAADVTDYLQKDSGSKQYELLAERIENSVEHSHAEQQANTTQRRLRELSEVTHDIHWMVTADWSEFLFVNSAYEDIFDRSRDELLENPMDFLQGVHPADREKVTTAMMAASNGEPADFEFRIDNDEDLQQWVWVQAEPIYDEATEPTRIAGFVRDITERKRRERTLTQTESIVEKMNDGAVIVQDGVIKYANPRLSEILGYTEDELVETPMRKFIAPDQRETVEEHHQARIAGEEADLLDQYELEVLSADGQRIPVEVNISRIDYQGQSAIIYIVRDITSRTHKEERFQAFIEQSTDVISVLDSDGTYQYQSPSADRILGYDPAEIIGDDAFEFVHPDDRERVMRMFSEAISDSERTPTTEYRFRHANGSWIWLESIGNNQLDNDAIEGFVVNSRDISERKRREQRVQRERDRLDKFAGTVSHDLRNPLNVAQSRLELAQDDCESEHLEKVKQAHGRMEQLIEDVLSLARAGEAIGETDRVDLEALVETCWENVETTGAELVNETDASFQADKTQLKQLLENLLRNAVDHVGGDVVITIGDVPGGFYVEDNGSGIPDSERSEVLDPGYSTSEAGTGFGLSIVRDVAEAHGWGLTVTESDGGGARFEFTDL